MHGYGCFVKSMFDLCKGYMTWRFVIVGYYLYLIERLFREYRAREKTYISKVVCHPADTIEIQFKKPSFNYIPGQYLFMNVPEVSPYQWHPFTITSTPYEDFVSIHIRQVGDFTKALGQRLGCNSSMGLKTNDILLPQLRIDGAFGAPAEDVFDHEVAVLVGTGIGVTPFASILKTIYYKAQRNETGKLRRVEFYWICRDKQSFEWFQDLLKELEDSMPPNFLRIHIYLTGALKLNEVENIVVNDSTTYDTVTELKSKSHFGRPSFPTIFNQLRTSIVDGSYIPGLSRATSSNVTVGVFYCGPNVFAKVLRDTCRGASTPDVQFAFSKEHF